MLKETYPYYLAGRAVQPNTDLVVTNKYSGQPACRVALADQAAIDAAIEPRTRLVFVETLQRRKIKAAACKERCSIAECSR